MQASSDGRCVRDSAELPIWVSGICQKVDSGIEQPQLAGPRYCARAIANLQLPINAGGVGLRGAGRDDQLGCNLAVRESCCDELQHLALAFAQWFTEATIVWLRADTCGRVGRAEEVVDHPQCRLCVAHEGRNRGAFDQSQPCIWNRRGEAAGNTEVRM